MKKIIYRIFKPSVCKRSYELKRKQNERLQRVEEVMDYLNKWDDIPISWQFTLLCDKLKIKPNQAAKDFIYGLNFGRIDAEKEARKLPLI